MNMKLIFAELARLEPAPRIFKLGMLGVSLNKGIHAATQELGILDVQEYIRMDKTETSQSRSNSC